MSLFRNRSRLPPPKETIQKDYDNGVEVDKLQQKIISADEWIQGINEGLQLRENLIEIMGETIVTDIMLQRIRQKMIDFQTFIMDMEDSRLQINYLDALLAVQDSIKRKALFESLQATQIQIPAESSTKPKLGAPTLYQTIKQVIAATDNTNPQETTPEVADVLTLQGREKPVIA